MSRVQLAELARIVYGRPLTSDEALLLAAAAIWGATIGAAFVLWRGLKAVRQ